VGKRSAFGEHARNVGRSSKLRDIVQGRKRGGCVLCGYSKCTEALEFHHVGTKDLDIGSLSGKYRSFDLVDREMKKCIVVCANCHREIHSGKIEDHAPVQKSVEELPLLKLVQKPMCITSADGSGVGLKSRGTPQ
jgi:hypothetical protein